MYVNPQVIFKFHETEIQVKMSPNDKNPIIYLNFPGEYILPHFRDSLSHAYLNFLPIS